jgi:hypothetical protein
MRFHILTAASMKIIALIMKAVSSTETFLSTNQTIWPYNPRRQASSLFISFKTLFFSSLNMAGVHELKPLQSKYEVFFSS